VENFAVKWLLKIAPHLAYVATVPYKTLMSAKQAINDRDGHGLGPSMGWGGLSWVAFSSTCDGLGWVE